MTATVTRRQSTMLRLALFFLPLLALRALPGGVWPVIATIGALGAVAVLTDRHTDLPAVPWVAWPLSMAGVLTVMVIIHAL